MLSGSSKDYNHDLNKKRSSSFLGILSDISFKHFSVVVVKFAYLHSLRLTQHNEKGILLELFL